MYNVQDYSVLYNNDVSVVYIIDGLALYSTCWLYRIKKTKQENKEISTLSEQFTIQ
jgi:Ca2+/Na+ antiporter